MNEKPPSKFRMWKFHTENKLRRNWRRVWKPALLHPICWVFGHNNWIDNGWTGSYERCSRCKHYTVLVRSTRTSTAKRDDT